MGTWINDPAGIGQVWQAAPNGTYQPYFESEFGNYWGAPVTKYDTAPYPGGGTKYDHANGAVIGYFLGPDGSTYQRLNDGFWYRHTPPANVEISGGGQVFDNGQWMLDRRYTYADMLKLGYASGASINDSTDHAGGLDLGMLAAFASVAMAGGILSGSLAPGGASAAVETTAAEAWATAATETSAGLPAATQGVTTVGETGLEWYSVDPGPDPFATTADVNAGWSYDGGYPGVDWYNNAGVGEAPSFFQSLTNSAEQAGKLVSNLGKLATSASSAIGKTRAALAQPAPPNYTRAAGSINLGLLAVAALAWKLL